MMFGNTPHSLVMLLLYLLRNCPNATTSDAYQYQITNYVNLLSAYKIQEQYSTVNFIPLADQSSAMEVTTSLSLFAINNFDEVAGNIEIVTALNSTWIDEIPIITSVTFQQGSLKSFLVPTDQIWTPNLVLTNAIGEHSNLDDTDFLANFNIETNRVTWRPRILLSAACTPNVEFYPFDKQSCEFIFTPWGYLQSEVILIAGGSEWDMSEYDESGEWTILETKSETYISNFESHIKFTLEISRKPLYATFNILLPVIVLCVVNSVVFLLPAESGERVGFSVTLFLSFMVCLNTVMDIMPRSSSPVSYLCFYLVVMMCTSTGMTLVTVLLMKVYHRPEKSKVPEWLSRVVTFINCGCHRLRCCVLMCNSLKERCKQCREKRLCCLHVNKKKGSHHTENKKIPHKTRSNSNDKNQNVDSKVNKTALIGSLDKIAQIISSEKSEMENVKLLNKTPNKHERRTASTHSLGNANKENKYDLQQTTAVKNTLTFSNKTNVSGSLKEALEDFNEDEKGTYITEMNLMTSVKSDEQIDKTHDGNGTDYVNSRRNLSVERNKSVEIVEHKTNGESRESNCNTLDLSQEVSPEIKRSFHQASDEMAQEIKKPLKHSKESNGKGTQKHVDTTKSNNRWTGFDFTVQNVDQIIKSSGEKTIDLKNKMGTSSNKTSVNEEGEQKDIKLQNRSDEYLCEIQDDEFEESYSEGIANESMDEMHMASKNTTPMARHKNIIKTDETILVTRKHGEDCEKAKFEFCDGTMKSNICQKKSDFIVEVWENVGMNLEKKEDIHSSFLTVLTDEKLHKIQVTTTETKVKALDDDKEKEPDIRDAEIDINDDKKQFKEQQTTHLKVSRVSSPLSFKENSSLDIKVKSNKVKGIISTKVKSFDSQRKHGPNELHKKTLDKPIEVKINERKMTETILHQSRSESRNQTNTKIKTQVKETKKPIGNFKDNQSNKIETKSTGSKSKTAVHSFPNGLKKSRVQVSKTKSGTSRTKQKSPDKKKKSPRNRKQKDIKAEKKKTTKSKPRAEKTGKEKTTPKLTQKDVKPVKSLAKDLLEKDASEEEDDGLNPDVEWADVGRILDFFFFLAFLALQLFLTVVFFIPIATN